MALTDMGQLLCRRWHYPDPVIGVFLVEGLSAFRLPRQLAYSVLRRPYGFGCKGAGEFYTVFEGGMYEHKSTRPLSWREFGWRMAVHFGAVLAVSGFTLAVGVVGYHSLGGLPWVDALLNASMILGGMGPVDILPNDTAKLFASFYALFSGLVFIGSVGVILAPLVHRVQHLLHWDDSEE